MPVVKKTKKSSNLNWKSYKSQKNNQSPISLSQKIKQTIKQSNREREREREREQKKWN